MNTKLSDKVSQLNNIVNEIKSQIIEIDITHTLSDFEIRELFSAFNNDDYAEVDRLTQLIEANEEKGIFDLIGIEVKSHEEKEDDKAEKDADKIGKKVGDKAKGHIEGAERLRIYWTIGEGGAKIQWRTPGDWTRCVALLSPYLGIRAKGYCNLRHKEMDGIYPAQEKDGTKFGKEAEDLKKLEKEGKEGDKAVKDAEKSKKSLIQPVSHKSNSKKTGYSETLNAKTQTKRFGDDMNLLEENHIQYKPVEVKGLNVVDEEKGIVEAVIAVTGIKDEVNDIIVPGAFAKTLEKRTPKGVWSHNWDSPVSKTLQAVELLPGDSRLPKFMANGKAWNPSAGALYIQCEFNMGTQRGRDAFADVKFFGGEQEWSLGYNVPVGGAQIESKTGIRMINYLDFFEYSPVLFGAMPEARTMSVKDAQEANREFKARSTGTASSWLSQVQQPMTSTATDMDDDGDNDSGTGVTLSAEQIQLIGQAISLLNDIVAGVVGASDTDDDNDDDSSDTDNDNDNGNGSGDGSDSEFNNPDGDNVGTLSVADLGYDSLTDLVGSMVGLNNLPQDANDQLNTLAGQFDDATQSADMDSMDSLGNQILDICEAQIPNADDDTKQGLALIAEYISVAYDNLTDPANADVSKQPVNQDSISEKGLTINEFEDYKAQLLEMKGLVSNGN